MLKYIYIFFCTANVSHSHLFNNILLPPQSFYSELERNAIRKLEDISVEFETSR